MNNIKFGLTIGLLHLVGISINAQIPFTKNSLGRIAISSDGNAHDKDDWAATAASLMLLAKADIQDKLTLYIYADHIWGNEEDGLKEMEITISGARERWGFKKTRFLAAVNNKNKAYRVMRDEINKSSNINPLYVIVAGPTEVIAQGMKMANPEKRKFVILISHSKWNEVHSDYNKEHTHSGTTWEEMKQLYQDNNMPIFLNIKDQNTEDKIEEGFSTRMINPKSEKWAPWSWMNVDDIDESIKWVYSRMRSTKKPDISDSGMIWFLLKNDENGTPEKLKNYIGTEILDTKKIKVHLE